MVWLILLLTISLFCPANAQFGEIASLATSLLGGALGGGGAGTAALAGAGAAGQAGGAIAQIGQLYQLAQGALQLTGTGVGVLNQASEGNWFPAVLEQTAKNHQSLMKGNQGLNLGALGPAPGASKGSSLGPEFGTSFPAPDIDDYDENIETVENKVKPPGPTESLVSIDSDEETDLETTTKVTTTTTSATTTEDIVLLPEEDNDEDHTTEPDWTTPKPKQIRIELPDKNGSDKIEETSDYEDLIKESLKPEKKIKDKSTKVITHGTQTQPIVPDLEDLVKVLQKSKLSKEEIDEIVNQVGKNKNTEKPAKYDFDSSVQNIPEKKNQIRQKIVTASRAINANLNGNEIRPRTILRPTTTTTQKPSVPAPVAHNIVSRSFSSVPEAATAKTIETTTYNPAAGYVPPSKPAAIPNTYQPPTQQQYYSTNGYQQQRPVQQPYYYPQSPNYQTQAVTQATFGQQQYQQPQQQQYQQPQQPQHQQYQQPQPQQTPQYTQTPQPQLQNQLQYQPQQQQQQYTPFQLLFPHHQYFNHVQQQPQQQTLQSPYFQNSNQYSSYHAQRTNQPYYQQQYTSNQYYTPYQNGDNRYNGYSTTQQTSQTTQIVREANIPYTSVQQPQNYHPSVSNSVGTRGVPTVASKKPLIFEATVIASPKPQVHAIPTLQVGRKTDNTKTPVVVRSSGRVSAHTKRKPLHVSTNTRTTDSINNKSTIVTQIAG